MPGPIYSLMQPVSAKVEGATLISFPDVGVQLAKLVEQAADTVPVSSTRGRSVDISR